MTCCLDEIIDIKIKECVEDEGWMTFLSVLTKLPTLFITDAASGEDSKS